ncbi:MAG: hypothetical protein AAF986_02455 [Pseudomonadota bacterium]
MLKQFLQKQKVDRFETVTTPHALHHRTATPAAVVYCFLLFLFAGTGALFAVLSQWPYISLLSRVADAQSVKGIGLQTDVTFLLSQTISALTGATMMTSTIVASMSALPLLMFLVVRTTPDHSRPWQRSIIVVAHPFCLALSIAGYGWATVGLYGLWRLLGDLPQKAPHQGMPLAGIGIVGAFITVPQFSAYLIPVAAVLFICAPRTMLAKHMRVFYLLSFTPVAMLAASLAYTDWLFGTEGRVEVSMPFLPGGIYAGLLAFGACIIVAPGLLRILHVDGGAARISSLLILILVASTEPVAAAPILAAAAIAQSAIAVRFIEPIWWTVGSLLGGGVVVILLDNLPTL